MLDTKLENFKNSTYQISLLKSLLVSSIFISSSLILVWLTHQFHLFGPLLLPMHLFIFVAALSFGWRVGICVGLLVPLISYLISGMPLLNILPQIIIEASFYGFTAGFLKEKLKFNIWLSFLIAMIIGRLSLGLYVYLSKDKYINVVRKKTASLFAASCHVGAIAGKHSRTIQSALI